MTWFHVNLWPNLNLHHRLWTKYGFIYFRRHMQKFTKGTWLCTILKLATFFKTWQGVQLILKVYKQKIKITKISNKLLLTISKEKMLFVFMTLSKRNLMKMSLYHWKIMHIHCFLMKRKTANCILKFCLIHIKNRKLVKMNFSKSSDMCACVTLETGNK